MTQVLTVRNLSIGYYRTQPLLTDINMTSSKGLLLLLLGSNGIGKSTLLKTIAGIIAPISGSILIDGKDINIAAPTLRVQAVSALFTDRDIDPYISVYELVALGRYSYTHWLGSLSAIDQHHINKAINTLQIQHLINKKVSELSDGEKQKALIAKCIAQDSPVIIMDEPTAFLDYKYKIEIFKTIKRLCQLEGKTILLSTHDIATALPYCDILYVLSENRKFSKVPDTNRDIDSVISLLEYS